MLIHTISILFILIGAVVVCIIANNISRGIKLTSKHLDLLAGGNLCNEVPTKYLQMKDEVGDMNSSMKIMQESLITMINRIKENSAENIDKDKNTILDRVNDVSSVSLEVSATSEEISASSEEMNATTEEVAASSQALSNMTKEMVDEVNKFKI